jgi:hypothetical protein
MTSTLSLKRVSIPTALMLCALAGVVCGCSARIESNTHVVTTIPTVERPNDRALVIRAVDYTNNFDTGALVPVYSNIAADLQRYLCKHTDFTNVYIARDGYVPKATDVVVDLTAVTETRENTIGGNLGITFINCITLGIATAFTEYQAIHKVEITLKTLGGKALGDPIQRTYSIYWQAAANADKFSKSHIIPKVSADIFPAIAAQVMRIK